MGKRNVGRSTFWFHVLENLSSKCIPTLMAANYPDRNSTSIDRIVRTGVSDQVSCTANPNREQTCRTYRRRRAGTDCRQIPIPAKHTGPVRLQLERKLVSP